MTDRPKFGLWALPGSATNSAPPSAGKLVLTKPPPIDYSKLRQNKSAPQPGVHRAPRIPTCLQRNRAARRVPAAFTTLADDSDSDSSSSDSSVELSQSDRDEIARIRRRRMEEKGLPLYERGFKDHRVRQSRSPSPAKVAPKIYEGSETVFDGCRQSGFQRKKVVYSSTSESEEEDKPEVENKPKEPQVQLEPKTEAKLEIKPKPEPNQKLSNSTINAPDMNTNYKKLRVAEEQTSSNTKTLPRDQKVREAPKSAQSTVLESKSDSTEFDEKFKAKPTELKSEPKTVPKPKPEPKSITVLNSGKEKSSKSHENASSERSLVKPLSQATEKLVEKSPEVCKKSKSETLVEKPSSENDILISSASAKTEINWPDKADIPPKPSLAETHEMTNDSSPKMADSVPERKNEVSPLTKEIEAKPETKIKRKPEPEQNRIQSIPKLQDNLTEETNDEAKTEIQPIEIELKGKLQMVAEKEDLPEDAQQANLEKDGKSIRAVLEKDAQSVRSELELCPSNKSPSDEAINCRTEIDRQIEDESCQTPSIQTFSEKKKASKKEKIELPDEEQFEPFEAEETIFAFKSFEYLFMWEWDVENETCAICRSSLMEVSPTNPEEKIKFESVVIWGTCGHAFHNSCMALWTRNNPRCPLCQQDWVISRIGH